MSNRNNNDDPPAPQYRSSYDVVGSSLREIEDLKEQGLFGLARLRWEAWLADRAAGHIERREKSNQKVLEARRKSVEQSIATAQAVEAMQMDHDRQIIAAVESSQRRMIAEASVQGGRLIAAPPRLPVQPSDAVLDAEFREEEIPINAPPVRPYLTDAQIDAIARRFLGNLPVGGDFEEAWAVYSATLESAVPTQARAEIKERAKALLSMNDGAA